jgi:hypothetical protein
MTHSAPILPILQRHEYLFSQRPLTHLLTLSYNYITCWLRSVAEARSILQLQDRHLRQTSSQFFSLLHIHHPNSNTQSEDDSIYSLPTNVSEDVTSTTLTHTSTVCTTDQDYFSTASSMASTTAYLPLFQGNDTPSNSSTTSPSTDTYDDDNSLSSNTDNTPFDDTGLSSSFSKMHTPSDDKNFSISPNDIASSDTTEFSGIPTEHTPYDDKLSLKVLSAIVHILPTSHSSTCQLHFIGNYIS